MPTTTKYAHPYPLASDVAAGHDQIQALAESVEAKHAGYAEGTYAARPATGKTGQFYRQTDAGGGAPANSISWWNGSAWIYIGLADGAAGDATARSLGTGAQQAAAGNDPRFVPTGVIMDYAGANAPVGWLLCAGQEVARATYPALDALIAQTYGSYTNGSGGAGTTHFRLPDLRGRVTVGLDNMGGTDAGRLDAPNALGGTGGAQYHALTTAQIPSHTHAITVNNGATGITASSASKGDHTHSASTGVAGSHNHSGGFALNNGAAGGGSGNTAVMAQSGNYSWAGAMSINAGGDHSHDVTVNSAGGHNHAITITDPGHAHTASAASAGSDEAHNNMQPYMLVNKIIKT